MDVNGEATNKSLYTDIFFGLENSALKEIADDVYDKVVSVCSGQSGVKWYKMPHVDGKDVIVEFETMTGICASITVSFDARFSKIPV